MHLLVNTLNYEPTSKLTVNTYYYKKKNYIAICSMKLSWTRNVMPLVIQVIYRIYYILLFITFPFLTFENSLDFGIALWRSSKRDVLWTKWSKSNLHEQTSHKFHLMKINGKLKKEYAFYWLPRWAPREVESTRLPTAKKRKTLNM